MAEGGLEMSDSNDLHEDEGNGTDTSDLPTDQETRILCVPCNEEGNDVNAFGYCVDCDDFLCETCFKHHPKARPCRNHVLQDLSKMPKKHLQKVKAIHKATGTKCHLHQAMEIKSYCKSHEQLCCEKCVELYHCVCNDVKSIEEIVQSEAINEEVEAFQNRLQKCNRQYEENKQTAIFHLKLVDETYDKTMACIEAKLKGIKTKDFTKITEVKSACETVQDQLGLWITDNAKFRDSADTSEAFIFRKMTEKQLEMTEENIEYICEKNTFVKHGFIAVQDDKSLVGNVKTVPFTKRQYNITGMLISSVTVNAIEAIDQYDILLVYLNNYSRLFNTKTSSFSPNVFGKVNCITLAPENELFLSIPSQSKLAHIKVVESNIENLDDIPIEAKCCVVKYHKGVLKILFEEPVKYEEYSLNGDRLRTIKEDLTCDFLTKPELGDMDDRNGALFVTCPEKSSVVKISSEGELTLVAQSEKLKQLGGIAVYEGNTLLVCNSVRKMILQIDVETGAMRDFLPGELLFYPKGIAVDQDKQTLYVGGHCNYVYAYQL